jgi:hypothetical protein
VFTVTPNKGKWAVSGEAKGSPEQFDRKTDAVKWAREHARKAMPSQLLVKGMNGRIQTEYTYGGDSRKTKG